MKVAKVRPLGHRERGRERRDRQRHMECAFQIAATQAANVLQPAQMHKGPVCCDCSADSPPAGEAAPALAAWLRQHTSCSSPCAHTAGLGTTLKSPPEGLAPSALAAQLCQGGCAAPPGGRPTGGGQTVQRKGDGVHQLEVLSAGLHLQQARQGASDNLHDRGSMVSTHHCSNTSGIGVAHTSRCGHQAQEPGFNRHDGLHTCSAVCSP